MAKFTAKELLESFIREYDLEDMGELYKAMIAYSYGFYNIDEHIEKVLDDTIDMYYDNDNIGSFVNEELMNYFDTHNVYTLDLENDDIEE